MPMPDVPPGMQGLEKRLGPANERGKAVFIGSRKAPCINVVLAVLIKEQACIASRTKVRVP
jgi:hypothetical protein